MSRMFVPENLQKKCRLPVPGFETKGDFSDNFRPDDQLLAAPLAGQAILQECLEYAGIEVVLRLTMACACGDQELGKWIANPSRFSPLHVDTSTGMSTKNQPTFDDLRICSSFALMMISARQKSQKSNSWETQTVFFEPAVLSATTLKQIFWARTAACNLFLYPLGFAGSSRCKF